MNTTPDILLHFRDRYMGPFLPGTAPLPASIRAAPWMHITDVSCFVGTHLQRSQCDTPLLRRLAIQNLKFLHQTLSS